MHSVLQTHPFHLDYPPSSSEADCIGHQRPFSSSATFPTEEQDHSRRIGVLGHPLSHQGATTPANGLPYSSSPGSELQDAPFSSNSGLLMSPLGSTSGTTSSSAYHPGYTSDGTSAETIIPTPQTLYSWNDRMSGYPSNPRIPPMLPSTDYTRQIHGHGASMSNGTSMIGRDNYPEAYALSSRAYPSSAGVGNMSHYSYSSSNMGSSVGTQLDSSSSMYSGSSYGHHHRSPPAEAPPFRETTVLHQVVTDTSQPVQLNIQAKIHKGFFQVDDKWTCYRRNYFSVTCSFTMQPWDPNATLYLQRQTNYAHEPIKDFAMSISAVVSGSDRETRELVQHSPKRDKQSEKKPDKVILQPHYSLINSTSGTSAPGYNLQTGNMQFECPQFGLANTQPPTQHTFERIQFQKATANNGKRRAQQQYYNLVVELYANVGKNGGRGDQWILVATRLSDAMVVRGRSPGHYKDGRRGSSASMGDSGGGHGHGGSGDLGAGMVAQHGLRPSSFGQQMQSYNMYDASRREECHYTGNGGGTLGATTATASATAATTAVGAHHRKRRRTESTNQSPVVLSPLMSSSSSSPFELVFSDGMEGTDSTDSFSTSQYTDGSSLRKKSTSTTSNQSSNMCPDLSSHSQAPEDVGRTTFDDIFAPIVTGYHSEKDEAQQQQQNYLKRQLAPLAHENVASRPGASSYQRFDPVQSSLCA